MRHVVAGVVLALAGAALCAGCSKEPDKLIERVLYEYRLMVTSLGAETSCASGVQTVRRFRDSGRQKLRALLKAFGNMGGEDRNKVSAEVSRRARALNLEYFNPFKARCPVEAAKVAAELDSVLARFKASLAPY